MRMRSYQIAGEGRITDMLGASVTMLDDFSGATPVTGSFIAQLEEWRAWRDEAWGTKGAIGTLTLRFPQGGVQGLRRDCDTSRLHLAHEDGGVIGD